MMLRATSSTIFDCLCGKSDSRFTMILYILIATSAISLVSGNNCSSTTWGAWSVCSSDCMQERQCVCDTSTTTSSSLVCSLSSSENRSCQSCPTAAPTTLPATSAATVVTTPPQTTPATTPAPTTIVDTATTDIAGQPASGEDDGSDAKLLVSVLAPIGSIAFICVLILVMVVIWKKRKNTVITVTRPIPEDKRRNFKRISEARDGQENA